MQIKLLLTAALYLVWAWSAAADTQIDTLTRYVADQKCPTVLTEYDLISSSKVCPANTKFNNETFARAQACRDAVWEQNKTILAYNRLMRKCGAQPPRSEERLVVRMLPGDFQDLPPAPPKMPAEDGGTATLADLQRRIDDATATRATYSEADGIAHGREEVAYIGRNLARQETYERDREAAASRQRDQLQESATSPMRCADHPRVRQELLDRSCNSDEPYCYHPIVQRMQSDFGVECVP